MLLKLFINKGNDVYEVKTLIHLLENPNVEDFALSDEQIHVDRLGDSHIFIQRYQNNFFKIETIGIRDISWNPE